MRCLLKVFLISALVIISAVSYGGDKNIPEFTAGIVDTTDVDLTGHIIVITDRSRDFPNPSFYCGEFEMMVYEAVVIHPAGGMLTSLEVGIPAINLDETFVPEIEVLPGSRFEVIYVLDCEARGYPPAPGQLILELKKF